MFNLVVFFILFEDHHQVFICDRFWLDRVSLGMDYWSFSLYGTTLAWWDGDLGINATFHFPFVSEEFCHSFCASQYLGWTFLSHYVISEMESTEQLSRRSTLGWFGD